jgi:hypothetical protein
MSLSKIAKHIGRLEQESLERREAEAAMTRSDRRLTEMHDEQVRALDGIARRMENVSPRPEKTAQKKGLGTPADRGMRENGSKSRTKPAGLARFERKVRDDQTKG